MVEDKHLPQPHSHIHTHTTPTFPQVTSPSSFHKTCLPVPASCVAAVHSRASPETAPSVSFASEQAPLTLQGVEWEKKAWNEGEGGRTQEKTEEGCRDWDKGVQGEGRRGQWVACRLEERRERKEKA